MLKRTFDILISALLWLIFAPLLAACALAVALSSPGPVLFKSLRVGREGDAFSMLKFRTMRDGTPQVATHLLANAANFITPVGRFLRRTSLDELPQLWNVLRGEMSLVGPRPALFDQEDLLELRRLSGADTLRPGISGWAQVRGRDELSVQEKAALDGEYLQKQSFIFDLWILILTVHKVFTSEGIQH
jgi:O-antigen biosynthesis protein WbqP